MSRHVSPWVYPVWDCLYLLDLIDYFLFHVGEIFNHNLFKNFLILWSNRRARVAVDCGETDQGDVRQEIVVGNACGGNLGNHGSKAICIVFQLGFLLEEDDYLYEEFEACMLIIAEYFLNFQKLINVTLKENLKCKSEHVTTLLNILLWLSPQFITYI